METQAAPAPEAELVVLHKLHAQDINKQFRGLPRPILMTKADYDKFIHGNDLCCYDLVFVMLGPFGVPFLLDRPREWKLAIGKRDDVTAVGSPHRDGYLVALTHHGK